MAISVGSKHRWTVLSNLKSSVSQQLLFPNHPLSGYDDVSCDLCPPFSLESFTAKVWDGSKNKAKVMSKLNYYLGLFTFEIRELFHSVGTEFLSSTGERYPNTASQHHLPFINANLYVIVVFLSNYQVASPSPSPEGMAIAFAYLQEWKPVGLSFIYVGMFEDPFR